MLHERAVRMVNETLKDNPEMAHKPACHQVGEQLRISGTTWRNWCRNPPKGSTASRCLADHRFPGHSLLEGAEC